MISEYERKLYQEISHDCSKVFEDFSHMIGVNFFNAWFFCFIFIMVFSLMCNFGISFSSWLHLIYISVSIFFSNSFYFYFLSRNLVSTVCIKVSLLLHLLGTAFQDIWSFKEWAPHLLDSSSLLKGNGLLDFRLIFLWLHNCYVENGLACW